MDTTISGPLAGMRQISANGRYTFVTPAITDTAVRFARIEASAYSPVIVEASICVLVVDATETVSVGYTASGYDDLIATASLATAATGGTFLPASNAVGKKYLTTATDLYYVGSAGADTGVVVIILDVASVNMSQTTGI